MSVTARAPAVLHPTPQPKRNHDPIAPAPVAHPPAPDRKRPVGCVAVDDDQDKKNDYVRTAPDKAKKNNLLDLPIWDRSQKKWI